MTSASSFPMPPVASTTVAPHSTQLMSEAGRLNTICLFPHSVHSIRMKFPAMRITPVVRVGRRASLHEGGLCRTRYTGISNWFVSLVYRHRGLSRISRRSRFRSFVFVGDRSISVQFPGPVVLFRLHARGEHYNEGSTY